MNASLPASAVRGTFMTSADYRESLRRYKPTVYVDGQLIESVADAPSLRRGVNALGVTYDFAPDSPPTSSTCRTTTSHSASR